MRLFYILLFTAVFCSGNFFCQEKSLNFTLYYGINEVQSPENFRRLDSLFLALKENISSVGISGHADFLSDSLYNKTLSKKRAEAVKNYLLQKSGRPLTNITCTGFGERGSTDNGSALGEPGQRRVDLMFTFYNTIKNNNVKKPASKTKVQKDTMRLSKNIQALNKGESLAIEGLSFYPGRHIVIKESIPVLENLLKTLEENPGLKIEIQGHICCIDGESDGYDFDSFDRKLSENRARAVYDYLVKKGIEAGRLTYKGYGHSRPKIPFERTPEEEQVNRRVEVRILEN